MHPPLLVSEEAMLWITDPLTVKKRGRKRTRPEPPPRPPGEGDVDIPHTRRRHYTFEEKEEVLRLIKMWREQTNRLSDREVELMIRRHVGFEHVTRKMFNQWKKAE
jgi:hypothetical protein